MNCRRRSRDHPDAAAAAAAQTSRYGSDPHYFEREALANWLEKGGEIRGKLNGIGFAQLLNMDVDTSQHLVVRDVSLQGSRLALPGSAAQENMPAEIRQQLEALDDEWHQQHNRFSEQQKCLFIPVEWLGRIEASLQDVGAQIKQAKQP